MPTKPAPATARHRPTRMTLSCGMTLERRPHVFFSPWTKSCVRSSTGRDTAVQASPLTTTGSVRIRRRFWANCCRNSPGLCNPGSSSTSVREPVCRPVSGPMRPRWSSVSSRTTRSLAHGERRVPACPRTASPQHRGGRWGAARRLRSQRGQHKGSTGGRRQRNRRRSRSAPRSRRRDAATGALVDRLPSVGRPQVTPNSRRGAERLARATIVTPDCLGSLASRNYISRVRAERAGASRRRVRARRARSRGPGSRGRSSRTR